MVVVFSHIDFFEGEEENINAMFEEGLEHFHLKKLGDVSEWKELLKKIPVKFHKHVVLHSNHELKEEFENLKLHSNTDQFSNQTHLSSSAHSIAELIMKVEGFEYVFLSPIYTSLSKEKYSPTVDLDIQAIKDKSKIVALGGVDQSKLMDLKLKGFENIALLGAVWMDSENTLRNFVNIKKEWEGLEIIF